MHPVLFRIPGVDWPLHTYGVLIVMGFLLAMFVDHREAAREGQLQEEVLDFAFWALLGGMIGARVVFIAVNWHEYFVDHPWDKLGPIPFPAVLVIWKGGLVFYGAALGGFAAFWIFSRARKLPMLKFADILIIGMPLAHAFGRLGCVAAGCCWGDAMYHLDAAGQVVADIPLSISFPDTALAYQSLIHTSSPDVVAKMRDLHTTMPLFPSQLAEAAGEACIFFALLFVRSRKWFDGQVFLTYAILYPLLRSTLEMFRGDAERGYVLPGLSTSQFISLLIALSSLIAIFVIRKRAMTARNPAIA